MRANEQEHYLRLTLKVRLSEKRKPRVLPMKINDVAVQGKVTFLSGESCLTSGKQAAPNFRGIPIFAMAKFLGHVLGLGKRPNLPAQSPIPK